tara:strand:+ start:270 stop:1535 length:1266 start_codon:yes stop_codon:yes gene_type:complete
MKSFLHFLTEAKASVAADQAARQNLQGDGHGNWFDKDGNRVAVTKKGKLEMLPKKEVTKKGEEQDDSSAEKEQPKSTNSQQDAQQQQQQPVQQGEFGAFGDGTPRRMPMPTRADGTPKEDLGDLTVVFGRFNPPTVGHQKLLDAAKKAAGKGRLKIYPSRTQDNKKNPYDADEKIELMKQQMPDYAADIVNDPNSRTIFDVLKQGYDDGHSSVKIVVGADRVKEFAKLSGDYNGQLYDFSGVEIVSAGDRDPDAEGVEGMSASKMRKAAAENDFKTYRSGIPNVVDDKTAKINFNKLRQKLGIKEGWSLWEIAPKFDWKNLRENYVTNNIFRKDSIIENLNHGLIGKIIRRGTNYVIAVTEDNIMFKSWLRDVQETVVNYPGPSGVPASEREVGTDSHRNYVARMTGEGLKNFINKHKKKK